MQVNFQLLGRKLPLFHELCFSINLAWPIVLLNILLSPRWAGLGLAYRINGWMRLHSHSEVGQYLSFSLITAGLAGCIFCL
jgi:hypothetical protein